MDSKALLDTGTVPNLISEKVCERLSFRTDQKLLGLTVTDGERTRSIGVVLDLPIFFDNRHVSMNSGAMGSPPFDVTIGVPTLEDLRGCLGFGVQQVTLFVGDIKACLSFDYAIIEVPDASISDTDSEDFTSDSEADPDDDENGANDTFVPLAYAFNEFQGSLIENAVSEKEIKRLSFLDNVEHPGKKTQGVTLSIVEDSDIIAWSPHDLSLADVSLQHYFELIDNISVHHPALRMTPKNNAFIRKELDSLLDAGIIVPDSKAWYFPVVIASEKDGTANFSGDYRSLNNVMKADRWPLPRIEEISDDL